jgi:hypothetical protein
VLVKRVAQIGLDAVIKVLFGASDLVPDVHCLLRSVEGILYPANVV